MDYRDLLYAKAEHVVTITINQPDGHNCLTQETNLELQHAWKAFRDDTDAFVAIYTGAGEAAPEAVSSSARTDKSSMNSSQAPFALRGRPLLAASRRAASGENRQALPPE